MVEMYLLWPLYNLDQQIFWNFGKYECDPAKDELYWIIQGEKTIFPSLEKLASGKSFYRR